MFSSGFGAGTESPFSKSNPPDNVLKKINKTLEEINTTLKDLTKQATTAAAAAAIAESNKNVMVAAAAPETSGGASKGSSEDEEKNNKYTVAVCMGILNEMKISFWSQDEAYVDVMKSFESKEWREVFVNMSEEQRRVWIETVKKKKYPPFFRQEI